VRDRASYAFALVSVAAGLNIRDGVIQQARLAMGGVAHKPWRAAKAEQVLNGQRPDEATFRRAAEAEMQGAAAPNTIDSRSSWAVKRVKSELGDSVLPKASVHGGSGTTASVGSAVHEACLAARAKLLTLASNDSRSPLHGATEAQVTFADGRIFFTGESSRGESYSDILRRNRLESIEATVDSKPDADRKFSMHAFCAHFIEVRVDVDLGMPRVSRVVSVCGGGRIMNEQTARSQLTGGIVAASAWRCWKRR